MCQFAKSLSAGVYIGDRSLCLLGCRSLEEVNIPSSVEYIGLSAFGDCVNLTQVELPDHLTEILSGTFAGCENLEINIPESIKSIGIAAFANCKKLSKVVLPEAINVVEDSTFYNCSGISELTIKGEVSSIGSYAFTDCSNLKKLNIEKSIGYIGRAAFAGTGIETLEIPESLSRYDASAFILCDSLTVAIIKETNRSLNVEGGSLFRGVIRLPEFVFRTTDYSQQSYYPSGIDRTHYWQFPF